MLLARRGYGVVVDEVQVEDKTLARSDVEIKFDMAAPLWLAPKPNFENRTLVGWAHGL